VEAHALRASGAGRICAGDPEDRRRSGAQARRSAAACTPEAPHPREPFVAEGIRTEVVGSRFEAGDTIGELADDYGCPTEHIEEAIRYEHTARHYQEAA